MNGFSMQCFSNLKKKGVLTMKKTVGLMVALMFVVGLGTAYAADYNGVTDFSGRSYDTFEIAPAGPAAVSSGYEGSAAGGKRLVGGPADSSRHIHDTFEIGDQGQAKGGMTRNWAGKESSVKAFDTFEIELAK